jgi:hypothetical protein
MGLQSAAESLGARVVLAPVAVADGSPRHDPVALASALHEVLTEPMPISRVVVPADATAPEDGPQGPDSNAR